MRMRIILAALVALFGASAQAGTIGVLTPYMLAPTQASGGGWVVSPGSNFAQPSLRSYTSSLVGGTARISAAEAMTIAGRAGPLAVSTATSVALSDAAVAVGRCILLANPVCAVATGAALTAYQVYRVFKPGDVPGSLVPAGSFDYDPGTSSVTTTQQCTAKYYSPPGGGTQYDCASTVSAAANAYVAGMNARLAVEYAPATGYSTVNSCGTSSCSIHMLATYPNGVNAINQTFTINFSATQVPGCPASIDASDPAYNVPAGGAIGPDGKCPTARYNHVAYTAEQAAAKVAAYPPTMPSTVWQQATKDAVESGQQTVPGTISTTGPATQTGPTTTTTTTPSGGTTTTTTHTPTYTYNYAGDTITYNTTYTDVTTNGGNTTTTTYNDAAAAPQDPKDPCTANPDRAGCASLGTPPTAEAIPRQNIPVNYTPAIFGSNASCPVDIPFTLNVAGWSRSYVISYTPACNLMTTLAPLFLALASITAMVIFMDALKA